MIMMIMKMNNVDDNGLFSHSTAQSGDDSDGVFEYILVMIMMMITMMTMMICVPTASQQG